MPLIYLDNNATTQPAPQVVAAMRDMLEAQWANPSSIHRLGQAARRRVELAREATARLVGVHHREILFTSGGTEADNLALRGILEAPARGEGQRVLVTTKIEHSAVREPAQRMGERGIEVAYLPLTEGGLVDPAALEAALDEHAADAHTTLVSIIWVNNETGAIQPVEALAGVIERARGRMSGKVYFHVDATQAAGKMPVDFSALPIDLATFAAHKFHGPKGVGALYIRRGVRLAPQQIGGPQERDLRAGTENTAGIVGMGVACELAAAFVADAAKLSACQAVRDRFERGVLELLPDAVVNRPPGEDSLVRLWNTSNIGFPTLEAEGILVALSERGVCASAGAACSSGSLEPSPVLRAMGIPDVIAHGSVRFSTCKDTAEAEADEAAKIVAEVVRKLSRSMAAAE